MIVPMNKVNLIKEHLESLMLYMTEEELDVILLAIKIARARLELENKIIKGARRNDY